MKPLFFLRKSNVKSGLRMFILRGEVESEACLVEVECRAANLRSGAAFIFVDNADSEVTDGHKL